MASLMEDFRGRRWKEHEAELKEKGIIAEGTVNNFRKPKKMKSKIGKLNKDWLQIQPEHRDLYRKVDEIIDYLNSQSQPEDTEHIKAHKEYLATSKQDTPEEKGKLRRDGALAFYIELEDWLYEKGYAKGGEIKVPTEVFMRFVAKELKLNNKKK